MRAIEKLDRLRSTMAVNVLNKRLGGLKSQKKDVFPSFDIEPRFLGCMFRRLVTLLHYRSILVYCHKPKYYCSVIIRFFGSSLI